jgi:hypothetical protein
MFPIVIFIFELIRCYIFIYVTTRNQFIFIYACYLSRYFRYYVYLKFGYTHPRISHNSDINTFQLLGFAMLISWSL